VKRRPSNKLIKGEKGQALLIVLLVTLFGSLVLPPMLSHMRTGLWTGREVFEERMYQSYAADSGIDDGLWQVKNKQLPNLFSDYDQYAYYDYNHSYEWKYHLEDKYGENGIVNGKDVQITFQNVWMPKDIPAPSVSEASSIAVGRLEVYGTVSGSSPTEYQIKINYYYNDQNPTQPDYDPTGENLRVQTLGIWLPPGFEYNNGLTGAPAGVTPSEEDDPYRVGTAVVWGFPASPDYPRLIDFSAGSSSINPIERTITFQFSGPEGRTPGTALSWIILTGVSGISYSWDSSVKVYKITSEATDETDKRATIEAYSIVTDMLKRGSAISGDYCAVGGTLMTTTTDQYYRDRLFKESSAIVQSTDEQAPFYIPANAHVTLAYLYWSGWLENAGIWGDDCHDLSNWISDSDWSVSSGRFRGHHSSGTRYLKMDKNIDLLPYVGQTVRISWLQSGGRYYSGGGTYLEASDGLDFAFSANGGITWTIPPYQAFRDDLELTTKIVTIPSQYLTDKFMMRFSIVDCSGSYEYVWIENIAISLGGSAVENARVNQVMFNGIKVTAQPTRIQTQQSGATDAPNSLSYSCFYNATALVLGMINDGVLGSSGSGTYTVGHVLGWPGAYKMYNYPSQTLDGTTAYPLGTPATRSPDYPYDFDQKYQWSYAAWSLVIVYSSLETQGHQLYLYDDFAYAGSDGNLDFDGDGSPGGTIGGFLAPDDIEEAENAAHLTCFVGEGDNAYTGDYIKVTGQSGTWAKLWDGTTSTGNSQSNPNNVWNSKSVGLVQSGIDIDTFTVAYPIIMPGDIWAKVDLWTQSDTWNLVYIILSFRSETIPGSTISYLAR